MDAGLGCGRIGVMMRIATSRRLITALAFALALLGWTHRALAWDAAGHRVVAEIASANIKPQTAARIQMLLKAHGQLPTPNCPVANLDDAATWPDCLRGDSARWQYTYAWHYQDVPVCGHFDIKADCPGGNCVSAQIGRMQRLLADRRQSEGKRLAALAFLIHFVGDIHQPLHVGDHDDRGGNQVIVSHSPLPRTADDDGRPETLHWFWDTLPEPVLADRAHPLVRRYSPAERARIATGTVTDWARESYELARKLAYMRAFHHDPCVGSSLHDVAVSPEDVRIFLPVVRQRLLQAGLRLARVLDQTLG
jgi:hypothetical protein